MDVLIGCNVVKYTALGLKLRENLFYEYERLEALQRLMKNTKFIAMRYVLFLL
jgi:hypothetical protein